MADRSPVSEARTAVYISAHASSRFEPGLALTSCFNGDFHDEFKAEAHGAARGIRTPDPLITNEVLYQLSYCGISMGS